MKLDGKVHGTLVKNKDGKEIPEDEFVVFRPHDDAFAEALKYYARVLALNNVSPEQIESTELLVERVERWRSEHPERCKLPDVEPGEIQT